MLTSISSSPMQVLDIAKVLPAKHAPEIGEHNEEILKELGFDPQAIDTFRDSEDDNLDATATLQRSTKRWLRTRTLNRTPNEQSQRVRRRDRRDQRNPSPSRCRKTPFLLD